MKFIQCTLEQLDIPSFVFACFSERKSSLRGIGFDFGFVFCNYWCSIMYCRSDSYFSFQTPGHMSCLTSICAIFKPGMILDTNDKAYFIAILLNRGMKGRPMNNKVTSIRLVLDYCYFLTF